MHTEQTVSPLREVMTMTLIDFVSYETQSVSSLLALIQHIVNEVQRPQQHRFPTHVHVDR